MYCKTWNRQSYIFSNKTGIFHCGTDQFQIPTGIGVEFLTCTSKLGEIYQQSKNITMHRKLIKQGLHYNLGAGEDNEIMLIFIYLKIKTVEQEKHITELPNRYNKLIKQDFCWLNK